MDGPGRFDEDTTVERASDGFHAVLSPKWEVWGPFGGYVAAVALRAVGAATPLRRPASFASPSDAMASSAATGACGRQAGGSSRRACRRSSAGRIRSGRDARARASARGRARAPRH